MMTRASLDPISYRKYGKGSVAIAHLTRERVSIPHRALICERMKYSFRHVRKTDVRRGLGMAGMVVRKDRRAGGPDLREWFVMFIKPGFAGLGPACGSG